MEDFKKIECYIYGYDNYMKKYRYKTEDRHGFITKFWDASSKKCDDLAVKGWPYERETAMILVKSNSYRELKIEEQKLYELLYEWLEPLYTD